MDRNKLIWQTALYTFIYCAIFIISIVASIYSLHTLIKAPVWTILIVLPLFESIVFGVIIGLFQSFGKYLIDSLNIHPAIIRSLFIYTILSTVFSTGKGLKIVLRSDVLEM
jgi:hypothetical protein